MKKIVLFLFVIIYLSSILLVAQNLNTRITIQKNLDFQTALKIIENFSLAEENKNIINMSSFTGNVPIQINQLPWKDALQLMINTLNLELQENPGVYIISDKVVTRQSSEYSVDDKMIRISATFFRADKSFLNSMGIDWSTLVDGEVQAQIDFKAAGQVADDLFSASAAHQFSEGSTVIEVNTLLKTLEANQKGSVIARPSITVLNGKEGHIQVGQDFSVKTTDEAGNISDQFFSTGIILTVTPTLIKEDDFELIFLEASVEKSNATPGQISTIINKNETRTDVLMFHGEETVMAGLVDVEYTKQRTGIPFLKDLPWWFLGLKYLFGYERFEQNNREMVVILKTEIVEPARERIKRKEELKEQFKRLKQDFDNIGEKLDEKPEEFKIKDLRD
jgi:type IV pilus assembly protein PilQ